MFVLRTFVEESPGFVGRDTWRGGRYLGSVFPVQLFFEKRRSSAPRFLIGGSFFAGDTVIGR